MRKGVQRMYKNQKGQALVETALVLPILIMLLLGIIQFGFLFSADLLITHLSREGARAAVVGRTDQEVFDMVNNDAGNLDTSKMTVQISPAADARYRGVPVTVTVGYDFPLFTPLFDVFLQDPYPLQAATTMRME